MGTVHARPSLALRPRWAVGRTDWSAAAPCRSRYRVGCVPRHRVRKAGSTVARFPRWIVGELETHAARWVAESTQSGTSSPHPAPRASSRPRNESRLRSTSAGRDARCLRGRPSRARRWRTRCRSSSRSHCPVGSGRPESGSCRRTSAACRAEAASRAAAVARQTPRADIPSAPRVEALRRPPWPRRSKPGGDGSSQRDA